MTEQQYSEIIELLEDSTESHLATAFDLIPLEYQIALSRMVQTLRRNNQRAVVRYHVVNDVANIVSGNTSDLVCNGFVTPLNAAV